MERAVAKERQKCDEELKTLETELRLDFVANSMFIICMERRRSAQEQEKLINDAEQQYEWLETQLENKFFLLNEAEKEREHLKRTLKSKIAILYHIVKEFQNIVKFVLKDEPWKADYLLNIEKLMIFELTRTCMEKRPDLFKGFSFF